MRMWLLYQTTFAFDRKPESRLMVVQYSIANDKLRLILSENSNSWHLIDILLRKSKKKISISIRRDSATKVVEFKITSRFIFIFIFLARTNVRFVLYRYRYFLESFTVKCRSPFRLLSRAIKNQGPTALNTSRCALVYIYYKDQCIGLLFLLLVRRYYSHCKCKVSFLFCYFLIFFVVTWMYSFRDILTYFILFLRTFRFLFPW